MRIASRRIVGMEMGTHAGEAVVALLSLGSRQVSQAIVLLLNVIVIVGKGCTS